MLKKNIAHNNEVPNTHIQGLYFQALYHAPIPILIVQENGHFLLINQALQRAIGFHSETVPTIKAWAELLQFDSDSGLEKHFDLLFQPEKTLMPLRITVKTHVGKALIWELFNAPLGRSASGQRMVICIAADVTEKINHERHLVEIKSRLEQEVARRTKALNITIRALENEVAERKRIGDALRLSRERLRKMSRRILTVLEADRRSISKELHDSLGASLAAIKFSLEDKELKRMQNNNILEESLEQDIACLMT
ncbi:MAG: PAS domain S-box protein, partial [Desulfobacteraceae bacterium]